MFSSSFFLIWIMTVSKFLFNDVLYMFLFVSKLPRLQVNAVKTLRGPPLPAVVCVIKGWLPPKESHRHQSARPANLPVFPGFWPQSWIPGFCFKIPGFHEFLSDSHLKKNRSSVFLLRFWEFLLRFGDFLFRFRQVLLRFGQVLLRFEEFLLLF